jgi:hypothetical protein
MQLVSFALSGGGSSERLDCYILSLVRALVDIREASTRDRVLALLLHSTQGERRWQYTRLPGDLPCETKTKFFIFGGSLDPCLDLVVHER